jgi:hypothetical protein
MFPGGGADRLENWVGVPRTVHGQISGEWTGFERDTRLHQLMKCGPS